MQNVESQSGIAQRQDAYALYRKMRGEYEAWAKQNFIAGASYEEVMALYNRNCNPELAAFRASSATYRNQVLTPALVLAMVAECDTMMANQPAAAAGAGVKDIESVLS